MNLPLPPGLLPVRPFNPRWRREKYRAFDLTANSSGGGTLPLTLWGRTLTVYRNANLSLYSRQPCNGRCPFCIEALRPLARGTTREAGKRVERDDRRYLEAWERTLTALAPLNPTLSLTGGEPSLDPALPALLRVVRAHPPRRLTITTNGSGLLPSRGGRSLLDRLLEAGCAHLNLSRHHHDAATAARIMDLPTPLGDDRVAELARRTRAGGCRLRLSCVLQRGGIDDLAGMVDYLEGARRLGVDNVVFRRLMETDPRHTRDDPVVRHGQRHRLPLTPVLEALDHDPRFRFVQQVVGYYYYVEVWRYREVDVVLEEADLGWLERSKGRMPGVVQELVFHPNGRLTTTWQPWDGVLGPP